MFDVNDFDCPSGTEGRDAVIRHAIDTDQLELPPENQPTGEQTECVVPKTLEEAFEWLSKLSNMDDFREHGPVAFHHTLGRWIRNNWGFWTKEGPLFEYFVGLGLFYADDMSGLILESFHRHIEGKPLDIEGQVRHYADHWAQQEEK